MMVNLKFLIALCICAALILNFAGCGAGVAVKEKKVAELRVLIEKFHSENQTLRSHIQKVEDMKKQNQDLEKKLEDTKKQIAELKGKIKKIKGSGKPGH